MGNHAHDNLRLRQKRRRQYEQPVAAIAKRAEIATASSPGQRKEGATARSHAAPAAASKSKPAASR